MIRNKQKYIDIFNFFDGSTADIIYSSSLSICIMRGSVFDIFERLEFRDKTTPLQDQVKEDFISFYTNRSILSGLNSVNISWHNQKTKQADLEIIIKAYREKIQNTKKAIEKAAKQAGFDNTVHYIVDHTCDFTL